MDPPDDDVAGQAGRLAATTTWYDTYLVLCAIPDQDLEAVAEALEAEHGPNVDSFLARAPQDNAGNRAAGFLAVEDQDPDHPALWELLTDFTDRLGAGDGGAFGPAVRLVAECVDLGAHLSGRTATSALALAVEVYQWRRDSVLFQLAEALVVVIAADADQLCARLDLMASLHKLLYEATGHRPDLDDAIALGADALTHAPPSGPVPTNHLGNQANRLLLRYIADGQRQDLEEAIAMGAEALLHAPPSGTNRAGYLAGHADQLHLRYQATGRRPDLDEAIALGAEALTHAPPSGTNRARCLAGQAGRLQRRYQASRRRPDLDDAIVLGAEALLHAPPSGPDRASHLSNQATRLAQRYQADGRHPDLDDAIALGAEALTHAPPSGPDRAMYLAIQATRLAQRYQADRRRSDLNETIALGAEALSYAPASAPDRAMYVSNQAGRLRLRYQADGDRGDVVTVAGLAREWSGMVARGAGTRNGVIGNSRWWMTGLCWLANEGVWSWAEVAATGAAVLARAAQYATLPEGRLSSTDIDRDVHALSVRAAVDGVVGLTALAWVRAGDARAAIQALENGAATVARDQASRIPWDLAAQQNPELAEAALDLQARILHAAATGAVDGLAELNADYAQAVETLRESLGLPTVVAATVSELARRASGPLVWVVATPEGGLALRLGPDGHVHHLELAALNAEASRDWHDRLHPRTDHGGPARREPLARALRGHGIPDAAQVHQVDAELDTALGEAAAWLGQPGTVLIPLGLLGGLPWQVTRPRLRLHVTATQATAAPTPAPPGRFVVYADAEDNLPGAREEATALADNHRAHPVVGPQATLAALAALTGCRLLHLAVHGTPAPALILADEAVHLGNVHRLRHLWANLELVVLNCCTSAATLEGVRDETLGLATIALTGGTRNALVALWPVDDHAAATFATAFHNARTHRPDPHRALAHARQATGDPATAAAYQLLG